MAHRQVGAAFFLCALFLGGCLFTFFFDIDYYITITTTIIIIYFLAGSSNAQAIFSYLFSHESLMLNIIFHVDARDNFDKHDALASS